MDTANTQKIAAMNTVEKKDDEMRAALKAKDEEMVVAMQAKDEEIKKLRADLQAKDEEMVVAMQAKDEEREAAVKKKELAIRYELWVAERKALVADSRACRVVCGKRTLF
jgi:hypothetical protein